MANEDGSTSLGFALDAAYPNPFADRTTLRFSIDTAADVRLEVFDVAGRRVATLAEGERSAGEHRATWDAAGLASGTYIARLTAGDRQTTQRLTLTR